MKGFQIGDRVRFTDAEKHKERPKFYPPAGTTGTVTDVDEDGDLIVQWDAILGDGTDWGYVMQNRVERIEQKGG